MFWWSFYIHYRLLLQCYSHLLESWLVSMHWNSDRLEIYFNQHIAYIMRSWSICCYNNVTDCLDLYCLCCFYCYLQRWHIFDRRY